MTADAPIRLSFVVCASDMAVLGQRLLTSPCFVVGRQRLAVHFNASSAADGFNAAMVAVQTSGSEGAWLVWVHQDVFLPDGWDTQFSQAIIEAVQRFPNLAVAGVYGIADAGMAAKRIGHVLDRGTLLRESALLPCLVDSLDELLFAVRVGSDLRLDASLGFDFYATDLVLQAQAKGLQCAVVDAFCEHWSDTPTDGSIPAAMIRRIQHSGDTFERKWCHRLPVTTPCFELNRPGDTAAAIARIACAQKP
jgi:hypothetical protein